MTSSFQIGPLALPYPILQLFGSVALAIFIGKRAGRKTAVDVESLTYRVLLVAVIFARLGFVLQYRDAYLASPMEILDIRDGGWNAHTGIVVAWIYTFMLIRPRPSFRKPLLAAIGAGSALWIVGSIAPLILPHDEVLLPNIVLPTLDGSATSLTSFKGRPTVVNLWATWCPPCQREMPMFQLAQSDHTEFNFIFANQGESVETVRRFLASHRLELSNVLLDKKGLAGARFKQSALPTTLFFDAEGRLTDMRIGELSHATLAQRLAAPPFSSTP
jgi:thiol-disulfide isomerase/thioredoxin